MTISLSPNTVKANEVSLINKSTKDIIFSVNEPDKLEANEQFKKLLPKTKSIIMNIIKETENSEDWKLEGNIEVKTKVEPLECTMERTGSPFTVKNEQVIYRRVSSEQPVLSKTEKFGKYRNNVILNTITTLANEVVSNTSFRRNNF